MLGGATHGEVVSSAVVRLLAIPLLAVALLALAQDGLKPVGTIWPIAVLALSRGDHR